MADRLTAAGGTLCIRSAPGLGTTISGRLPAGEPASGPPGAGRVTPPDSPDQHDLFVSRSRQGSRPPFPGLAQRARPVAMAAQLQEGPFQPTGWLLPSSFRPYFAFRASTRSAG